MAKLVEKNLKTKKVILPRMSKKEYEKAWRNFWKLMDKVGKLWKTKKVLWKLLRKNVNKFMFCIDASVIVSAANPKEPYFFSK
jgi:hypothetical protein